MLVILPRAPSITYTSYIAGCDSNSGHTHGTTTTVYIPLHPLDIDYTLVSGQVSESCDMVLTFSLIILGLLGVCQCHLRLSCELAKFLSREDYRAVAGTNYEAQCSSVTSRELEEASAYIVESSS